jgi:uncharacterized protein (DUF2062 family)
LPSAAQVDVVPKQLIKRYLPDPQKIREHKHLRLFGRLLHDPNLWHLNRRSVSGSFSVGLFITFIPVPFHMILATAAAIIWRVNLPLSVALVWINNPVTMPPFFYFAYKLGAKILGTSLNEKITFDLSFQWIIEQLAAIWQPFLLGCLVLGTASAVLGNVMVRLLWRLRVVRYLKRKRLKRQQGASS